MGQDIAICLCVTIIGCAWDLSVLVHWIESNKCLQTNGKRKKPQTTNAIPVKWTKQNYYNDYNEFVTRLPPMLHNDLDVYAALIEQTLNQKPIVRPTKVHLDAVTV